MCRKPILAVLCALLLGPVWSASAEFDPNLAVYWPLDEGSGTIAYDATENGIDGTMTAGPVWTTGVFDGGLQFTGTGDLRGAHVPIDSRSFTIAMWVNPTLPSGSQILFSTLSSSATAMNLHLRLGGASSTDSPVNGIRFGFYNIDLDSPANAIQSNQWYHLTFWYDFAAQKKRIYINGVQVAENTSTAFLATSGVICLGSWTGGNNFTGIVDDFQLWQKALSDAEVVRSMNGLADTSIAANPVPEALATDVPRDVVLGWTAGEFAATHDVYFGTSFEDVNDATQPVQSVTDTAFDPDGLLEYGQTYYWRIDEVNAAPDNTVFKGEVWSFTAETYAYPITGVTAEASAQTVSSPPTRTIDGSGLDEFDQHGFELNTMWATPAGALPASIQYAFEKEYKLHEMWVWNANSELEVYMGFGAKDVAIEYSTDGETWTALENVPEFAQGTGLSNYTANTVVNFGEVMAKYVKLTINDNWGTTTMVSLSEVRFFYTPVQAFEPDPADSATGVGINATLNWRPGREATSHQVYFGADPNALTAEMVTDHSYTPAPMDLDTAYYWKVDETGDAGTYEGDVWSFTTQEFLVVDDFESYTDDMDAEEAVFQTWSDGYDDAANGSIVGIDPAVNGTFCETTIVHSGRQSMPIFYDNTGGATYAEAKWEFDSAQDWTVRGIKTYSLFFHGAAGNSGQLYVKINNTKVAYDGDAADVARAGWQVWNIDLSKVGNVGSVRSLTIGIEGSGTKGKLYIDDIRLYPKAPEFSTPVEPDSAGLVAYYAMTNNVQDGSGKGNNGVLVGAPTYVQGLADYGTALSLNGTTDCVDLGNKPVFNFDGSFSLSVWANIAAWGTDWGHVMVGNRGEDNVGWQLRRHNSNKICFTTRGVGQDDLASLMDAPVGEWVHIAAVYDNAGNTKQIYVNGIEDALVNTTAGKVAATTHKTYIGARANSANTGQEGFFIGMLDDIRIYTRTLSFEEIAWLAGRRLPIHKPL